MKTKINRKRLKSAALFLSVIGPRICIKTSTATKPAARPRALRMLLFCGTAAVLWALSGTADAAPPPPPTPPPDDYPHTTVQLSGNTTILPASTATPPPGTVRMNVSASTNFKGLLEADPKTGMVRVTNAHPDPLAGPAVSTYFMTVSAFNSAGDPILPRKFFRLTVETPATCNPVTFGAKRTFAVDTNPRSVAIGDFDRDGKHDLAIANRDSASVSVFLGNGAGKFGAPNSPFLVGGLPDSVAVGDFNGDGKQDFATANQNTADVSVRLGDGMGGFGAPTNFPAGDQPTSLVVGDFNGDAKQDLAVANETANPASVSVLLGDGFGNFPARASFPSGMGSLALAVGNFDGGTFDSGKQDLAVTRRGPFNFVSVLLGTGPVGMVDFNAPIPFGLGNAIAPLSVAVGDFDGDGTQDLATANNQLPGNVSVLRGDDNGSGNFGTAANFAAGSAPQSVAVGDFNGDRKQDLAVANFGSNNVWVLSNTTQAGGNLTFSAAAKPPAGSAPQSVAVGDFNGDGMQDLAVANSSSSNVSILLRQCSCLQTFSENFDGFLTSATNLPPGWMATNALGPAPPWVTSTTTPDTAPRDAFVEDPDVVSDKYLDTKGIFISSDSAQVSFHHSYNLEASGGDFYDGGVLEISVPDIANGAFLDITDDAVGGSFVPGAGEYDGIISTGYMSPIALRRAWSGNSGGYICTVVNLGPHVNGKTIKLRFRMASDNSVGATGWRVDTILVSNGNGSVCCTIGASPVDIIARVDNISTRMQIGTRDNVGIGGFIITGTAPKHVLIRAIGPSLAQSGAPIPGTIADPVLELHGPGAFATITNNNWRDNQEAEIQATGIPPTDDRESAIDATLFPGAYSAVVRGNNDSSGLALVEVYDLEQGFDSNLANLSTRALVGTGDNIVIAGVILGGGDGDGRIVVRGIGPSLAAFGLSGALADPTMELRDSNGALQIANNDWQDDPAQAAELAAAGLAPTNQLESGVAATLPPGAYTALLAGLNNGVGIGLVEVYDLGTP